MSDLKKTLIDIKEIKSQIARGTQFRGYGPATFAATGVLAAAVACLQAWLIGDPANRLLSYFALWILTGALSAALIAIEVFTRSRRIHSGLADEMIQSAAEQMLPAIVSGGLVCFVLARFAPENLWMMPGLWQILLSLGAFASCRLLPPSFFCVGVWYLLTGLACLALANGADAFSPWAMGLPFCVGQLLGAALIYRIGDGDGEG